MNSFPGKNLSLLCVPTFKAPWQYLLCFLLLCQTISLNAQTLQPLPEIKSYVLDQTSTLTQPQIKKLSEMLQGIEEKHGSQVVLVLLKTTSPEAIEQYSIRLAEENGIGRKDADDGVLILFAGD